MVLDFIVVFGEVAIEAVGGVTVVFLNKIEIKRIEVVNMFSIEREKILILPSRCCSKIG